MINEYDKSYKKLAFVFAHDIKTFEGYKKLSGLGTSSFICLLILPMISSLAVRAPHVRAFSCFDIMVKHSCAFLIYSIQGFLQRGKSCPKSSLFFQIVPNDLCLLLSSGSACSFHVYEVFTSTDKLSFSLSLHECSHRQQLFTSSEIFLSLT